MGINIINLKRYPKFWNDFESRLHAAGMNNQQILVHRVNHLVQDWYGYTAIGEAHRRLTEVTMDDHDLTMFLLRWA